MSGFLRSIKELSKYPSAIFGLVIILILVILAIYTMVKIPYSEALVLWRGGEEQWYNSPRNAAPVWTNWFSSTKKPVSFAMSTADGDTEAVIGETASGNADVTHTYTFDYQYDDFPQDMALYFTSTYEEKPPHALVSWITPDGREIRVVDEGIGRTETYVFSGDDRLTRRLDGERANVGLFADPNSDPENPVPLKGEYQLVVRVIYFEEGNDHESEFVLYGEVAGMAGTDHRRRDLSVALLWGIPVALIFGLLAAVGTTVTTMVIAAVGVWHGGWIDEAIQRITEVTLILPLLPILIMIGTFYSKSIWVMLGVIILLSIFGAGIKTYRAVFLQVKESPYIEAAQAYGASSTRIIIRYLVPRIVPLMIPQLVVLIPTFVFLEASLAVLGLGDPTLPTWGKVLNDAYRNAALYNGFYYWVLEPAILLMLTGLAFAMLGFSLDRIFNPRLRGL